MTLFCCGRLLFSPNERERERCLKEGSEVIYNHCHKQILHVCIYDTSLVSSSTENIHFTTNQQNNITTRQTFLTSQNAQITVKKKLNICHVLSIFET